MRNLCSVHSELQHHIAEKWPRHIQCVAALIDRPVIEHNWMFINNENKYILSFTPRTLFLNKRGEALRRN